MIHVLIVDDEPYINKIATIKGVGYKFQEE